MYLRMRTTRWQDWANLILGLWLFVAPWVLDFAGGSYVTNNTVTNGTVVNGAPWNAWISGAIIFFAALWALATPSLAWPEWINGIVGIWVFISPWVLDFTGLGREAWDAWIVGAVVFLLALWAWLVLRTRPPVNNTYGPYGTTAEPGGPYGNTGPNGTYGAPRGADRPVDNYPPERPYPPTNEPVNP